MPLSDGTIKAFTRAASSRLKILETSVGIAQAFNPTPGQPLPQYHQYSGIWDTGASGSVVTPKVVEECGLVQTGIANVSHGGGISEGVPTYLVSIGLPNNVTFPSVTVTVLSITGADVLVGMDIIGEGDFAVTAPGGNTKFTFRLPSTANIDFVAETEDQKLKQANSIGRNDPCPCGSGKKYKKCCMKKLIYPSNS